MVQAAGSSQGAPGSVAQLKRFVNVHSALQLFKIE